MSQHARITTLQNGLRVVSEPFEHVETAAIGVWIDAGGRDEPDAINGAAHMLEHMAFKGTARRSALDIAMEIENVGGQLNAYTGREQTAFYARTLKDDWPLALDILADILQHSTFDKDELERERHVVLQEIGQVNDTPDDLVFDRFQAAAFAEQSVGRSILGPPEIVSRLQGSELQGFMNDHYDPRSMVVSAAGKIEHQELVDACEQLFAKIEQKPARQREAAHYTARHAIETRDLDQLHIILGVEGISYRDDRFYAAQMLAMILGGGMSSRLFQEVREKRGLAYSVFSFASCMSDSGVFGIYTGTGGDKAGELIEVLGGELKKLRHDINADEVERARNQIKAGMMMGLESCSAVCEDAARQLLCFDRRIPPAEVVERFDAVTIDDLHGLAEGLLDGGKITSAALGPWPADLAETSLDQILN